MECYVCCDSNPRGLRSNLCECSDRWLHVECQYKLLLTTSEDGRCTVCKAPFRNLTCVVEQRVNKRWIMGHILRGCMYCGMILSVVLLSLHVKNINMHTNECRMFHLFNSTMHAACLVSSNMMLLGNVAVFMLMLICFMLSTGGICLINRCIRHQPRVWITRHWRVSDDGADTQRPESASLDGASM